MKKLSIYLCFLSDVLAIGLIPINALLIHINMPEFVSVIAALTVITAAVYFIKTHKSKIAKIVVGFFAVAAAVISILGSYCNPYWNSIVFRLNSVSGSKPYSCRLSSDKAKKDLNYAMKYLRKLHPALYKGIPDNVRQQYESVKEKLEQCDDISVNDLAREIESVFAVLHDAHTFVRGSYTDNKIMKYYNEWINDGYKIMAVNGVSTDNLLKQNSSFYSFELSSLEYELLIRDIITEAGLDYLGFDWENGIEYTLISADGNIRKETCYPDEFVLRDEYYEYYDNADTKETEESFVRYETDMEKDLAILHLDKCNYNDEYIDCVRSMFKEIKDKHINNVVVDLRYNGGGNSMVADEFFRYLDVDSCKTMTGRWRLGFIYLSSGDGFKKNNKYEDLVFHGNLYLLTSVNTFSSAMDFAQLVKDNNLGTIVGEAPANSPNHYGDVSIFKLPYSGLLMQISTKQFYRADRECTDELVYPDIECRSENAMEELYKVLNENR